MPIIIEMPALSPTMLKGNLIKWCCREGDKISIGAVLAEIETDKAIMEIESRYNGVIARILIADGTKGILIKTPIAVLRMEGDSDKEVNKVIDMLKTETQASSGSKAGSPAKILHPNVVQATIDSRNDSLEEKKPRVLSTPLARRIAELYEIDLSAIHGTGPNGRIVKADVLVKVEIILKQRSDNFPKKIIPFVDEPLSEIKKAIAEKLTNTKNQYPHFYMMISIDVTELLMLKQKINLSHNLKLTVTDFLIKAVALAMKSNQDINVAYVEAAQIRRFSSIDVSVAIATEWGLYTPVIREADKRGMVNISKELKEATKLSKGRKISTARVTGGSITISNLGMFGIDSFYSIINAPQASILSIGPAVKTPVFDENDNVKKAMIMKVGYAIDHRVIDGQAAAKFLIELQTILSDPVCFFIDSLLIN
ncbi:MAG: 2-oxo acid dehydrogenase subunit E2 [Holosporales bacterium]|jgi:pyruvate dehydrogenase E2 component (dihydrolipoamide acetyltransferase)|nr:2-oxo acid dehydrogenase subunit E2 [Holosporales bacterium]